MAGGGEPLPGGADRQAGRGENYGNQGGLRAGPGAEMPIRGLRYIRGETSRSASPNVRRHAAGRHVSRAIRRHEARSSS